MYHLFLLLVFPLVDASELPAWHMKPLGSHIAPEKVDETFPDGMISAEDFANKYVLPRKPIVFRDVVKEWPAFKLWTDEYLKEKYGDMELRLEAKKEKQGMIPKGDVCLGRDTMKTFLNEYNKGADKYVVSELPTPMWHDVLVPPPMACGEFLTSYVEIDLWINSDTGKKGKGGNSILHKDAFNTVNCVINGSKEWKLIELQYNDYVYQSWEGPLDAGYGGFSLINTEKVDAKEFPDVGKIPRWQFVTMNAGDCLYLPSQMWHQVKSFGETNKAVAFLFSQFNEQKTINTTACDDGPEKLRLSDVDVDLQYPGNGIMTMGHMPIEDTREQLMELVDDETGLITPKTVIKLVYNGHRAGAINKEHIKEKGKTLYKHMLTIAGNQKGQMTANLIKKLTRDQIRFTYNLILRIEPANSCTHEYSSILPEDITYILEYLLEKNNGKLKKDELISAYENELGGTHSFAVDLWKRLAGDKLEVDMTNMNVDEATRPHEEHRRDNPENDASEDATITTPQGHVSQPKKRKGGYGGVEDEKEKTDNNDDNIDDENDEGFETDTVDNEERDREETLKEEL